jgi:hypothetical protein
MLRAILIVVAFSVTGCGSALLSEDGSVLFPNQPSSAPRYANVPPAAPLVLLPTAPLYIPSPAPVSRPVSGGVMSCISD